MADSGECSLPYICINCHSPARTLNQKYSDCGIRLTNCERCGKVVDKYVEYDLVLVIIDLILQYSCAYRHLLVNTTIKNYTRLGTIFVICDAYKKWIERRAMHLGDDDEMLYDLEWSFYECVVQSAIEMAVFILVVYIASIPARHRRTARFVLESTVCGFYGNVLVVLNIIWRLHHDWTYNALTQCFLLVSHIQVQRTVVPEYSLVMNVAVVIVASLVQLAAGIAMRNHIFVQ